jgi:hypothetical protein
MVIVAGQVQLSAEYLGEYRWRERRGSGRTIIPNGCHQPFVSVNMAFEDRGLGSVAQNVRGNPPSPKGVTLSYDTANQKGLEFTLNKPHRDNRQQQDARALGRSPLPVLDGSWQPGSFMSTQESSCTWRFSEVVCT